ncbi:MAG: hypothetical protein JO348_12535 [Alphaproteobacteria bacterium]|nr:hypothetical protein [Alphaproteobacteria bacterium]MBV9541366.1 hypothetical protein [Alphaproteobacteria bacterium]MBV9903349.1 hypothetical protein [Alphaproteobacteria bacterium]
MRPILALLFGVLVLTGCSKPQAPAGRWEGGYDQDGTFIAARLEIETDGKVRVSAPDVTDPSLVSDSDRAMMRRNMAERLAGGWGEVVPRPMSFDGKIFRLPGRIAPQIEYDNTTNVMTLYVYLGTNPVIKMPLKPVADFSDNPF